MWEYSILNLSTLKRRGWGLVQVCLYSQCRIVIRKRILITLSNINCLLFFLGILPLHHSYLLITILMREIYFVIKLDKFTVLPMNKLCQFTNRFYQLTYFRLLVGWGSFPSTFDTSLSTCYTSSWNLALSSRLGKLIRKTDKNGKIWIEKKR